MSTELSADLFAPPAPYRNQPGPISTAIRLRGELIEPEGQH
ncbi:hypothetical protein [Streptomyces sp. NPDC045470]